MHEQTQLNLEYYSRLVAGRKGYWRYMPAPRFRARVILDTLKAEGPSSVIDLGCGDGSLLAEIRAALPTARLAGIDLSAPQIEANRLTMPDIEWRVGNIENGLADLTGSYAALTCSEVIEHLVDPATFLRTARSLAADGALLVLSTQSGRIGATEKYVGHLRHFTREEMTELLERSGWRPLRVWNAGFPFQDLSKWMANLSPDRMIHHFGDKPYGAMQKSVAAVLRLLFRLNSHSRGAQLFATARKEVV